MGKDEGPNFEKLKTQHLIIVEDKTLKWLVSGIIIRKMNYSIEEGKEGEVFDYVKNNENVHCGIYTLNGKSKIKIIPNISGFENLKSLLLIVDRDAEEEIKRFNEKVEEKEKEKEKNEKIKCDSCLIPPSQTENGNEVEDYIYIKLNPEDKAKFDKIESFIKGFCITSRPSDSSDSSDSINIKRKYKRIFNILLYIESENLNDIEKYKRKYVENIVNNIDEKEEVFKKLKNFLYQIIQNNNTK
jgi:hypothetical protein